MTPGRRKQLDELLAELHAEARDAWEENHITQARAINAAHALGDRRAVA